jgi:hypothetical protein
MKLKFWLCLQHSLFWLSRWLSDLSFACASRASYANLDAIISRQRRRA